MSFFEAIEPIFRTYVLGNAPVKQIASGFDWTEGPVWFDVGENGALGGGDVFHVVRPGAADGFRLDCDGNLWTSAADGVHCISPQGALLGKILVPEQVSNVCFGGRAKHRLFITATNSVYCVVLNREGVQRP